MPLILLRSASSKAFSSPEPRREITGQSACGASQQECIAQGNRPMSMTRLFGASGGLTHDRPVD